MAEHKLQRNGKTFEPPLFSCVAAPRVPGPGKDAQRHILTTVTARDSGASDFQSRERRYNQIRGGIVGLSEGGMQQGQPVCPG